MMVIPLLLDAFYFWVVDNILKLNPNEADKEIQDMYLGLQEEEVSRGIDNQVQPNKNHNNVNIEVQILSSR